MGFRDLFKSNDETVLGVDIGSSSIKVVQLAKKHGRAILQTYGELALGPYANLEVGRSAQLSQEQLVTAIKDIVREAKVTTKTAGMALPLSSSLLSFIQVPVMDEKQLAQSIPLEARKYVPVPITEVSLDWMILPKQEGEYTTTDAGLEKKTEEKLDIVVVAIHNDRLAQIRTIATNSALDVGFFELELFSTVRSLVEYSLSTEMIIDFGAATTKLYMVEQGMVRAAHTITKGSQDITLAISKAMDVAIPEAERLKRTVGLDSSPERAQLKDVIMLTLDYIFYEANRVMLNYQKKYNKNVIRAVLTGGGSLMNGLIEVAQKNLETEVIIGDPFSRVNAPAYLTPILKNAGPSFSVAIGVALRHFFE